MSMTAGSGVEVLPIDTPSLGDRSYLAHDGKAGVVVDPQRDMDRVSDLAAELGVRVTHVAETHIHNDYVTGGLALAQAAGARYLVNAADPVRFARTPVHDGDRVEVGAAMALRVDGHPGAHVHPCPTCWRPPGGGRCVHRRVAALRLDRAAGPARAGAYTEDLARAQYRSAHRLATELPDGAPISPRTGSAASARPPRPRRCRPRSARRGRSTRRSPARNRYVDALLAGLDAWPAYYAHMAPANAAGPAAPDLSPPRRADPAELRRRIEAGEWVVDLRDRVAFAAGFLPGSVSFPIDGSFATYLGWVLPWGTPVTLLGESPAQVGVAQRELVRIGIDRPAAAATGAARGLGRAAAGHRAAAQPATSADLARPAASRAGRCWTCAAPGMGRGAHRGRGAHPAARTARPAGRGPAGEVWVHCPAGTAPRSPRPSSPPRAAR